MTHHYIAHDAKGYVAWRLVNGRYHLDVGPHFPTPREAMRYADSLDAAFDVSPLRASGEASTARTSAPSLGVGSGRTPRLTRRDKAVNPASPTPGQ